MKKIISLLLAAAMLSGCSGIGKKPECSAQEVIDAYKGALQSCTSRVVAPGHYCFVYFTLYQIDDDGVPELVVWCRDGDEKTYEEHTFVCLYTYRDGALVTIDERDIDCPDAEYSKVYDQLVVLGGSNGEGSVVRYGTDDNGDIAVLQTESFQYDGSGGFGKYWEYVDEHYKVETLPYSFYNGSENKTVIIEYDNELNEPGYSGYTKRDDEYEGFDYRYLEEVINW